MYTELILCILTPSLGAVYYVLKNKYIASYEKFQVIQSTINPSNSTEVQDQITLELQSGRLPSWLHGIMYRIGPGQFDIKQKDGTTFSIKHAFDGLPFVHRFELNGEDNSVKYNSRNTAKSVAKNIEAQRPKGDVFFGHIPSMNFSTWLLQAWYRLDKLLLRPNKYHNPSAPPDIQSVGVTTTPNFPLPRSFEKKPGEKVLVSKTDANILQKVNADTLEPETIFTYTTYDKRLEGQFSAAHHQLDPITNESFNFTLTASPTPRLVVFSTNEDGDVTVLTDTKKRADGSPIQPAYIHSFWLTKNFIIIPEAPLAYSDKCLNFLLNGSALSSMNWDPDAPTYFHVIRRHLDHPTQEGLIASIPHHPGFFTFHTGNAYETTNEHEEVILNLESASFNDGDIMYQLYNFGIIHHRGTYMPPAQTEKLNGMNFPPTRQPSYGDYTRYRLNLNTGTVLDTKTLATNLEFPRFNQDHTMQSTAQYVYGCQMFPYTEKKDDTGGLVKVNVLDGSIRTFAQDNHVCSEPIFVRRGKGMAEDDGVLLTLLNTFGCCYLIVVDALEMKELARFKIGQFGAVTFHGSFVDHEFENINVN